MGYMYPISTCTCKIETNYIHVIMRLVTLSRMRENRGLPKNNNKLINNNRNNYHSNNNNNNNDNNKNINNDFCRA